ncbi:unnamed protein product [Acanthoscelides obtectus]|uniref:Pre-C2HC domain-containing protein n=1 Tax=Acanthoscelides obtectus TaxID=200917 RepID=A0A9P0PRB4_ACAOB|nr:unnamed protein product [Acanthoscelides obtectus]CAK1663297.1 hypothetical protein AOBTE_LOCUS23602 [Acanthoscelides obtectus]
METIKDQTAKIDSLTAQVTILLNSKESPKERTKTLKRPLRNVTDDHLTSTDEDVQTEGFVKAKSSRRKGDKADRSTQNFPPLPNTGSIPFHTSPNSSNRNTINASTTKSGTPLSTCQVTPSADVTSPPSSRPTVVASTQPSRQGRITPIVLRDGTRWRTLNFKFISLGIKIDRAVAVDAGIRIIPKSEDDYRKIVRLFREEEVPHHTFPLPSERNIHAVVRGVPVNFSDTELKGELEQRGYSPLHIIRLKCSGGAPMPWVVVILPKTEKSQQVFNEHELLGLAIRVEVQKNSRLNGQ